MVRDIDPLPTVPMGKNPVDRIEVYLKSYDPSMSHEISLGAKSNKNFNIGTLTWSLALFRQQRPMIGHGFFAAVRVVKGIPKMGDFIKLEKDLETTAKNFLVPNRAVILAAAPANYNGISDDLYTYLTEKNHYVLKNGKKCSYKLQLFVEHSGHYEIIPLLP